MGRFLLAGEGLQGFSDPAWEPPQYAPAACLVASVVAGTAQVSPLQHSLACDGSVK